MLEQIDNAIAFSVVMLMLSLIVTAVVQVISAVTDLRGRNLASGLTNLFQQIEPAFRKELAEGSKSTIAESLAEIVVKHPAVAHAGTRAKAISQEELVRVLRDLCSDNPATEIDDTAKTALEALFDTRVPAGIGNRDLARAMADQLGAKFPSLRDEVKVTLDAACATVSKLEHEVGEWFDTIMNRLSDIFTRKTRVITVVASLLLVALLQIDTGEILRQITNNPGLRAKLATMSDTALSQANKIFDSGERATAAVADVRAQNDNNAQLAAALDKDTPHLTSCVDGRNWFIENIKAIPDLQALEQQFDTACQDETRRAMGNSYDQIQELQSNLQKTDLRIIPEAIGGRPLFDSFADWWAAYRSSRHLLGTLVSIIFLSLGAPFWFNMLSQLSSLKPVIQRKVGQ